MPFALDWWFHEPREHVTGVVLDPNRLPALRCEVARLADRVVDDDEALDAVAFLATYLVACGGRGTSALSYIGRDEELSAMLPGWSVTGDDPGRLARLHMKWRRRALRRSGLT